MVLKSTRCSPSAKIPNIDDSMLTSTKDNLNQDINVSDNVTKLINYERCNERKWKNVTHRKQNRPHVSWTARTWFSTFSWILLRVQHELLVSSRHGSIPILLSHILITPHVSDASNLQNCSWRTIYISSTFF